MNPFDSIFGLDVLRDIIQFHERYGLTQTNGKVKVGLPADAKKLTDEETNRLYKDRMSEEEWDLRHKRLKEEIDEYLTAVKKGKDAEALDAIVDLVYIALGTCYRRGWDFRTAWNRVHKQNMQKERGTKRNSKYGSTYDIVKPKGWTAPNHDDLV